MAIIQATSHYEIPAEELAKWLEQHVADSWWNVDGDPLLTGRLSIPCPSDELAAELRKINRPLLVEAKGESGARGQVIDSTKIGSLARIEKLASPGPQAPWVEDRFFHLSWKGSSHEWFLVEDSVSAKQFLEDAAPKAN
ncbi:MAG: hypothetical protein HY289_04075 [Planctomycetes bacterium]|nr:hypothetical protein [Planctomycetota bacterium]